MIVRPHQLPPRENSNTISAWEAIARTERVLSANCVLIRQPDHARLAGDLAEHLHIEGRPQVTDDIIQGISLHDEGWSAFDTGAERLQATAAHYLGNVPVSPNGRPLSFLDIKAADFLRAWRASIEAAEAFAPIAGLIVSGHFCRLAKFGIRVGHYSADDAALMQRFISQEERRHQRLAKLEKRSSGEIEYWTDVLQFCDLLSLYLCCGSQESVEFPQQICVAGAVVLRVVDGLNTLSPSLLEHEAKFTLRAYAFPRGDRVTLNWKVG